ncbi:unnamed protein product [Rhizoctonia solani]|uniref:Uncharacterized protein n=1 Tax=Rhizoctonia solani TaxID=456999 RepID=A0A8H3A9Q0_9AGAM|nr:unnamed protein product [Rhizoctonia solani]
MDSDPPPFDLTPLMDLEEDRSRTNSSSDSDSGSGSDDQPQTQEQNTSQAPLTSPPTRSVRELVESLGSPLGSSASSHSRTRQSVAPASPSPFDDPVPFRDEVNRSSTGLGTLLEQDSIYTRPTHTEFIPSIDKDSAPDLPEQDHTSLNAPQPTPWAPQLPQSDIPTWLNPPVQNEEPLGLNPSTNFGASLDQTPLRTRPEHTAFAPSFGAEPEHTSLNIPREPPSTRRTPWVSRPIAPTWLNRHSPPLTRPTAHTYSTRHTNIPPPAYPWNNSNAHDTFDRPDVFSRTTAHTTISDILFNFDLDGSTMSELLADACETARQVGVSTHELLSRTVFLGTTDLGISPLCLEASRVDVEGGGGMELVWWLIENTRPSEVYNEVRKGCLMRRGGEGEQSVWNVLRGLVPDVQGKRVAYDVQVDGLAIIPAGLGQIQDEDDEDEGSLYENIEIIDAESGFLDQADIETLKSSSDEAEREDHRVDPEPIARSVPAPAQVHRACIIMPSVNEHLTRHERLTAEWIHQGRLWALSITQDTLVLGLRQTSSVVPAQPIYVRALVRLVPLDLPWTAFPELDHIGPDRILPTQIPSKDLLSSPLYECELDERVVVPGVSGIGRQSSLWRSGIRVSMFNLWELVGPLGGFKLEVVVRTSEEETEREVPIQVESDAGDWQWVDE